MKIYYTNINRINEEIEDFVIAKNKIEKPLIESGELEKKMTIQEFINYIDFTNNVFMVNDKENSVIPFEIKEINKDELVVAFSSTCNDEEINEFKSKLDQIGFNLSKLTKHTPIDLLTDNFTKGSYFILNGEFYT